ncbi:diguanylate cyclase domain-containing protein [Scleromatobacter humisilvae]|uniref:Diguanylate cyclase n=1 Tax=Scleromatobacter humisilvae TaxID=2897159 RepID=A0A9X2C1L6_9BURK|nr:diguanylate cyclase [Scleromatobacter humisilvae]MCK9685115.1 diguanylate cyclase [Scleromatobacter humisilvae]
MRIRNQLLAFVTASVCTGILAAAIVFAAGRREDAAGDAQARAQVTEHEVAGLLALTQEVARYAEPRAAEQWRLRHAAIAAALADDARVGNSPALVELRDVTQALPALFTRLEELPSNGDAFTARRKEALLDQLLTNTQSMSDYAYQWFQDSVEQRRAAESEFRWIALAVPCVMLLMLLASAIVVLRRVLLPMQRLDRAAAAIRRGDMTFRLGNTTHDEFGDLSREFDAMTAALIASDQQRDRSEQQLRDITDNLPALVAYIDRGYAYQFANEKYREWLGIDPFSMVSRRVPEVLGEDIFSVMLGKMDKALAGERVQWERSVWRDGVERHLLVEYIPDVAPGGTVRGFYALSVDITERRGAELEIARSEQRMADLTNAIPAMVGYFDMAETCLYANDAGLRSLGVERARIPGISMREALGETVYAQHEPYVREALQGRRARLDGKVEFAGRAAHFQAHMIPDRSDADAQRGFYLMTFDITALKEAEARRAKLEGQLRAITDNLPVAITYLDDQQRYRFVNRTGLEWLCRPADEVIGQRIGDLLRPVAYERRRENIETGLTGKRVTFEAESITGDVTRILHYVYIPDIESDGRVAGLYGLATDVSALKNVEKQLGLLVRSDVLTGVANRYSFNETFPLALSRARRAMSGLALMYLDIDHFKSINDTLGHAAGDEVLKAFAKRLQQSVRTTDTVARLGGDEFVIVLEGVNDPDEPQIVARKIVANVTSPLTVEGRSLTLTTSIGIAFRRAIVSADAATAEAMIGRADAALYAAKKAGRNTWRVMADDVLIEEKGLA